MPEFVAQPRGQGIEILIDLDDCVELTLVIERERRFDSVRHSCRMLLEQPDIICVDSSRGVLFED